jgi:16S rRNA (guanine966-N2)-methyltransferase
MIRITGGDWKGRKLKTPAGLATRPTPSRVREALFNVLGDTIQNIEFYDLFAGSGAMGFEALSRGVARAVFVEGMRGPQKCLRANIEILDCQSRTKCVESRLPGWLRSPAFHPESPAALFIDPPYRENLAAATLQVLGELDIDWSGDVCALQTDKSEKLDSRAGPWRLTKCYSHGDTLLWLYHAQ